MNVASRFGHLSLKKFYIRILVGTLTLPIILFLQIFLLLISTATCAQLNNNYLPPVNAAAAGGSGLKAPSRPGPAGGTFAGANVPLAPSRPGAAPSRPGPGPSRPGAAAAPSQPSGPPIEIISYENVNNGDGSYKWR